MSTSSSAPRASEKLMMSLVDANLPLREGQTLSLSKLPCPSTQQTSLYLQVPRQSNFNTNINDSLSSSSDATNYICEIQALPTDFGSFLVTPSNTVIGKDSNLYLTTVVDPLFFVLQHPTVEKQQQWQPWDQILESMDATLRAILPPDRNQLMHLFARMPVTDDEVYYKFSTAKALAWLQKKLVKIQATLERQQQQQQARANSSGGSTGSGNPAVASTFVLGNQGQGMTHKPDEAAQAQKQAAKKERLQQRCRADALQIVCDYLNETWKSRFLGHVDLEAGLLESPTATGDDNSAHNDKRPATSATDLALPPPAKKAKAPEGATVGLKRLAKVNTKGMKKMSAFFGVANKKENVKNKH